MVKKNFSSIDFFKLILLFTKRKSIFILGVILCVIATVSQLMIPQFTRKLIDASTLEKINYESLKTIIAIFAIQLLCSSLGIFFLRYFGEYSVKSLRESLWSKLLNRPVSFFDSNKSGELTSRLVNDTTIIKELVASQFPNFITSIMQILGSVIILFLMDWKMAALIFSIIPVTAVIVIPVGRVMSRLGKKTQDAMARFMGEVSEKLNMIRLIKSSNGQATEIRTTNALVKELFDLGIKDSYIEAIIQPLTTIIMLILFVGILGYGGIRVQDGSLTAGAFIAFLLYLFNITTPAITFTVFFSQFQKAVGASEKISQIINVENEFTRHNDRTIKMDISQKKLLMKNVFFQYEGDSVVLNNISFEAKPNTITAFVGPSGGGKTTIFSLIERFYSPDKGSIKIDTTDISSIDLTNWRSQLGYVSQDNRVFSGTIRDNLQYGLNKRLDDRVLWEGLSLACADEFVSKLPRKLDTYLGENGVNLSGGQKQRITIARAFLRDPKILMLDEATANLDSQSEFAVQKALANLMKNRTTLVIAHRLSTISKANKIYFIENGSVTGVGTHKELFNEHPLYRKYVEDQSFN